jgi:hypothetical protein
MYAFTGSVTPNMPNTWSPQFSSHHGEPTPARVLPKVEILFKYIDAGIEIVDTKTFYEFNSTYAELTNLVRDDVIDLVVEDGKIEQYVVIEVNIDNENLTTKILAYYIGML